MAVKGIKNRIFGSDIPTVIKKKLESRQQLAYKSPANPNQQIEQRVQHQDASGNDINYTFDELNNMNFGGVAELSSRTPFVRMWTSLKLSRDEVIEEGLSKQAAEDWKKEKYAENNDGERINALKPEYKDIYLKKVGDVYNKHKWSPIPADEGKSFKRIYQIGNHVLNTLERGPNSQVTKDPEGMSEGMTRGVLPYEQETDNNQYLRPPAGITGLSSETEGALGTIKKTTVNFQVHNFSDFERIYLRYFLRPGAQIFVDFGWDTSNLYNIKTLLEKPDELEDLLYGDTGSVTTSKGDLETIVGHVINYDAKVREDGGFDCMVEIVSKNTALISNAFDPNLKERVKYGLDIEALGMAVSGVLGDNKIYDKAARWGEDPDTEEELRETLEAAALKLLGGNGYQLPGTAELGSSMLALEHGIYYAGSDENNLKLFANFGWLEDRFFNKEFGFSDDMSSLTNANPSKTKLDEGSLKAKFNSRNSFVKYSIDLKNAMTQRHYYEGAVFLYPETWGSAGPTYNIKNGMVPDRFSDATGNLIDPANMTPDQYAAAEEFDKSWDYKSVNMGGRRCPLREIFVSIDMIKESMDLATSAMEFFNNIMSRIKDASGGIVDLAVRSNNYSQHTISFIDQNYTNDYNGQPLEQQEMPEFLKKLFLFKPYSKNTIVKQYDLQFKMPTGGLGNMLGIQAAGSVDTSLSINSMVDGFVKLEMLSRHIKNQSDIFIRYNPSIGEEAGRRFEKITGQSSAGTFSFNKKVHLSSGWSNTEENLRKVAEGGFADVIDISGKRASDTTMDDFTKVINYNLNRAVDPDNDLDGHLVKPTAVDDEETPEDTKRAEDNLARAKGQKLVNTPYDFWIKNATHAAWKVMSPTTFIEASLTIYGISSLVPGDLIRINYLPENYLRNVYFQITKVSHNVGTTWDTTLTCMMKICSSDTSAGSAEFRLRKSYLKNVLKLRDIDSILHMFDNLEPLPVDADLKYIDQKFLCYASAEAAKYPINLPPIPTDQKEKVAKRGLGNFLKAQQSHGLAVKYEFDDWWDFGLLSATGAFTQQITSGFTDSPTPTPFLIYTSGKNWMVTPLASDNQGSGYKKELEKGVNKCFARSIRSVSAAKMNPKPFYEKEEKPKVSKSRQKFEKEVAKNGFAIKNGDWTGTKWYNYDDFMNCRNKGKGCPDTYGWNPYMNVYSPKPDKLNPEWHKK